MFNKKYKVKHYKSRIYNPIRGKIVRAVLIIVVAGALFAAGWFAYEPLMKAINNANKEIIENDPISKPEQEKKPEELPQEFMVKIQWPLRCPLKSFMTSRSIIPSFLRLIKKSPPLLLI